MMPAPHAGMAEGSAGPKRRLTVLLHCQNLSGAGHFVRSYEIARALGERHEVHILDGGWSVPRAPAPGVRLLAVPRLARDGAGELTTLAPGRDLGEALRERRRLLEEAARALRPDIVIVEHFPFSKRELADEILALIGAARRARPGTIVLSSVRDTSPGGRFDAKGHAHAADDPARGEPASDGARADGVREALERHFDGLLVHGDPRVLRLADEHPWLESGRIPSWHTGYVVERRPASPGDPAGAPRGVTVSSGGLAAPDLHAVFDAAWAQLAAEGRTGGREVRRFGAKPAPTGGVDGASRDESGAGAGGGAAGPALAPFGLAFLEALASADLAVSRAGYNTVASILASRVRAVLVPDPRMRDQMQRARRLAALGLAQVVEPQELTSAALARAMRAAIDAPRPRPSVDLRGAERTREIVEGLVAGAGAAASWQPREASCR